MRTGIDWNHLIAATEELMHRCHLCERRCGIDRLDGGRGFCGAEPEPYIYKDFIHYGEEPELIPSHTIFMSGCNMRCAFCSNYRFQQHTAIGRKIEPSTEARRIGEMFRAGSRNVNFLGGEPTVNLLGILKILQHTDPAVPVIWNSNMYASEPAMSIITAFTDLYLADFKFGNDACAARLAGTPDYTRPVTRNLIAAAEAGQIIVRHLPLAGHEECCSIPVIDWVAEHLPGAKVNLMESFLPARNNGVSGADQICKERLKAYIRERKLRAVGAMAIDDRAGFHLGERGGKLETELFIDRNGAIIFQDFNAGLLGVADRLSRNPSNL